MTKGKFAVNTNVESGKTLGEIRALLKKYKGNFRGLLEQDTYVSIAFTMNERVVRFTMPLPVRDEMRIIHGPQYGGYGRERSEDEIDTAIERATRQRWRALLLTIKAKLESVELGVETFEEAFMPQLVLPSGQTTAEWFIPQYKAALESGNMPPLLPSTTG